jgi:hypothetical protein
MTGSRSLSTSRKPRTDPLAVVTERLRGRANEARAMRSASRAKSRERWLGVDSRTVTSARRQVSKSCANDPDALFNASERLIHGARFREEKELALSLLETAAKGLCDAHFIRCIDWFGKLQDQDHLDRLAMAIGATFGELPSAQRRLIGLARAMNPLHRRAALECATAALATGPNGLKAALMVAELALHDRSPQVRDALARLLATLSREAPKRALPFLARYGDDLTGDVFAAALSPLPAIQQRQLLADRARGGL